MRLIARDLRGNRRFAAVFIGLMGLGISGFLLVESLRASVTELVRGQGQSLLGADISVAVRRRWREDEITKILALAGARPRTEVLEFFSMVYAGKNSQLAPVRGVDATYPLYGRVSPGPVAGVVLSEETLLSLGAKVGEQIEIGGAKARIAGVITEDTTQSLIAIGGPVYVARGFVDTSGLIKPGATVTHTVLFKTEGPQDSTALRGALERAFPDPEVTITSATQAAEGATVAIKYLGDFLGLMSLVALMLSAVGTIYLFRWNMERRRHSIAVLRALGMSLGQVQRRVLVESVILGALSLVPAALVAGVLFPVLGQAIALWSPLKLSLGFSVMPLLAAAMLSTVGAPFILASELVAIRDATPMDLFREGPAQKSTRPWWSHLGLAILLVILAPLIAHSYRIAAVFLGLMALAALVMLLGARGYLFLLLLARARHWTTRHGLLLLTRRTRSTYMVFLILGLGSLVIQLLPQIEGSLRQELAPSSDRPTFFVFDLQEEQRFKLEKRLETLHHKLEWVAPLVRARLISRNGEPYERVEDVGRTRESEVEARLRNRGVNLTYRSDLYSSESLVKGRDFSAPGHTGLPEVSVEVRYADRMGMKVGDVLKFDVQGIELEAVIVNLRRVRWSSFRPNFFVVFEPGILEAAPKTFLANLSHIAPAERQRLQRLMRAEFPNVSLVDVASVGNRILALLNQMRWALVVLSLLTVAAGLTVVMVVLALEAMDRRAGLKLFRLLGATERELKRMLTLELLLVTVGSVVLGGAASIAVARAVAELFFEGVYRVSVMPLVGLTVLMIAGALMFGRRAIRI